MTDTARLPIDYAHRVAAAGAHPIAAVTGLQGARKAAHRG